MFNRNTPLRVAFSTLSSVFGDVLKHGLTCLIYYRKRNPNEARLSSLKVKRDVKFLSNESVLHLRESLVRKTNFTRKVFVQGSLLGTWKLPDEVNRSEAFPA